MSVDPRTLQVGEVVTPVGPRVFATHRCEVIAIQRLRFRAQVRFPDGHVRWFPTRELSYLA